MDPEEDLAETNRLVDQARSGDRGALGRLYEKFAPLLRSWIRRHRKRQSSLQRLGDTEDFLQSVWGEVIGSLRTFEPHAEKSFPAWLRRLTDNRLISKARKAGAVKRGAAFGRLDGSEGNRALSRQPSPGPGPHTKAVGQEAGARLRRQLSTLDPKDREALRLAEAGLPLAEIGKRLENSSADSARMRIKRARIKLRQAYERGERS